MPYLTPPAAQRARQHAHTPHLHPATFPLTFPHLPTLPALSFCHRRWCVRRTYEYYLPAFCLGLSEDTPAEEAARVVALFKDSLSQYVGRKPFHNYTARWASC